jgi:chromosome segregation ATPase
MDDRELIAYFDRQFQEIHNEIGELRQETREQIGELRQETRAQIGELRQETSSQFGEVYRQFGEVNSRFEKLETALRHTQVVIEGVRSDVQMVAEGVATVDGKVERFRTEMQEELKEVRSLVRQSYGDLDRRVSALEKRPRVVIS